MRFITVLLLTTISLSVFAETRTAVFAGGCFWCMEKPYDELAGVVRTTSGYTGGAEDTATYEQTSSGKTGHFEAIEIEYEPDKVSYEKLLEVFWSNIDPLDARGQFCDKGPQYRAAVFVKNAQERELAESTRADLQQRFGSEVEVVTQVLDATPFYAAEDYHQDYYLKNPLRYKYYRYACGRDNRLKDIQALLK